MNRIDYDRRTVGLIYFILSLLLTPVYVRIIHVFIWNSEFRNLRCYRIMTQIGIIDCVFILGYAVFGMTLVFESEFHGFTHVVLQLLLALWVSKCSLNLVLAINRLTVMCGIEEYDFIHWTQITFSWSIGAVFFVISLTPKTRLVTNYGSFTWMYDFSMPWAMTVHLIDLIYTSAALALAFLLYLIAAFLLFLKRSKHSISNGTFKAEVRICVMALVLFSSPMTGALLWNFGMQILPDSYWTTSLISIFSICNIALAAPTVYLVTNKSLRRKVMALKLKRNSNSSRVQTTINVRTIIDVKALTSNIS